MMRTAALILMGGSIAVGWGAGRPRQEAPPRYWNDVRVPARPPEDEKLRVLGREVYSMRCAACHGREGDGDSVAAPYLATHPRDFVAGHFKLRSTPSNRRPMEEDLYRTVTVGFPQYGMPSFEYLSETERWAVVKYLKTFSRIWTTWEEGAPVEIRNGPEKSPALVERGRQLYNGEKYNCASCHGATGMGDGPEALKQKDAWGHPSRPRAFALGASYFKRGNRPRDIVQTLLLGMSGSPMMPFVDKLDRADDPTDLWALAYYVRTLSEKKE